MPRRRSKQSSNEIRPEIDDDNVASTIPTLLKQRAHTSSGFCAVAVVPVGELHRVIVSYDPDRAIERMHLALGIAVTSTSAGESLTDARDWFSLSHDQAHRILIAAALPVVPLDWERICATKKPSRFSTDEVYWYAIAAIGLLLNDLHVLHIFPLSMVRPPVGQAEKLAKVSRRFRDVLNEEATDRLVSDWPELTKLRGLTSELTLVANMTADARQAEAKRLEGNSNARQTFVREKLTECFQTLYGRKAGVSRPGGKGEAGGPFVRFATSFFAEIGLPVAAETVARDLRRSTAKKQPMPAPS